MKRPILISATMKLHALAALCFLALPATAASLTVPGYVEGNVFFTGIITSVSGPSLNSLLGTTTGLNLYYYLGDWDGVSTITVSEVFGQACNFISRGYQQNCLFNGGSVPDFLQFTITGGQVTEIDSDGGGLTVDWKASSPTVFTGTEQGSISGNVTSIGINGSGPPRVTTATPEPSTLLLGASGFAWIWAKRRGIAK